VVAVSGGSEAEKVGSVEARLDWLDGMKGIAILWILFFHFFCTYEDGRLPWPLAPDYFASYEKSCAPHSLRSQALCFVSAALTAVTKLGFHAVGVFLVLSGCGLSYSLAKIGNSADGWLGWYRTRVIRLFPMYWVAHLVYLVSPFQARLEPMDYRFILSILGDRVVPIGTIFYYFNPALWFFGLILQLYVLFPVLFVALERWGVTCFLVVTAAVTFGARWVLLFAIPGSGEWVQGGFFAYRLWEFAVGMAVGVLWRRRSAQVGAVIFSRPGLLAGAALYALGLYSYGRLWSYIFTEALIGTGLAIILAHVARLLGHLPWLGAAMITVGTYSYGLYLVHQPYVLYFGARMRSLETPDFLVAAVGIVVILTFGAMTLERGVNRLTSRTLRFPLRGPAHAPSGSR
jgi:peptidoglycan/LPS O-acetylase OafA/YrhL